VKAPLVVCASMLDNASLTAPSFKKCGPYGLYASIQYGPHKHQCNQLNASLAPLTLVASLLDMRTYIPYFESMTRTFTYA
jgi:hypothetical protein